MSDSIEKAVKLAREDGEALRTQLQHDGAAFPLSNLLVDGSMYSPSWRALAGGNTVYTLGVVDEEYVDMAMAYEETLDAITDELGLYWEEGCLWRDESHADGTTDSYRAYRRGES